MRIFSLFLISFLAFSCSEDAKQNNGLSENNGQQNNGLGSNNGQSTSNNGTTNSSTNGTNNATAAMTNNSTGVGTNNGSTPSVSVECSEGGFSECFLNSECQASELCKNISDNGTQIACCIPGVRGTKKVGDDCTGDDDTTCESGICIGGDSNKSYCSAACTAHDDCPAFMKCVAALGVCAEGTRE